MKVILRTTANMPISPRGKKIKFEIQMLQCGALYRVMFVRIVANKVEARDEIVRTDIREEALDYYNEEVVRLTYIYNRIAL
jgi:hypothetical protein